VPILSRLRRLSWRRRSLTRNRPRRRRGRLHKAQHKKRQIAKRDRNDNRIKRQKAGELGVSLDEDPSPEPSWSGDVASAAIDGSNMSGSSSSSLPRGVEVSSSHWPQAARRDKTVGSSSRLAAPSVRDDQRMTRSRATPSGTGAPEPRRPAPRQVDHPRRSEGRLSSARQLYDGSERPDSDSLQRRRSRGRSSNSASTPNVPLPAEPSAAPRRLQSLLIRGGGAPDVHVSLVPGGGHGPTPAVVEAGGSAPEHTRESVTAIEAVGRGGAALRRWGHGMLPSSRARSAQPQRRACRIAR
jgi:hypothetical protein